MRYSKGFVQAVSDMTVMSVAGGGVIVQVLGTLLSEWQVVAIPIPFGDEGGCVVSCRPAFRT